MKFKETGRAPRKCVYQHQQQERDRETHRETERHRESQRDTKRERERDNERKKSGRATKKRNFFLRQLKSHKEIETETKRE